MANAQLLDGRRWSVDGSGLVSVTRRYLVNRGSNPSGTDDEEVETYSGLPAIGTKHNQNEDLKVVGYDFEEGTGNGKRVVVATVKYGTPENNESESDGDEVEFWGWRSGSVARDLTHDVGTGKQVLNTYGDPFDSVPQVDRPSPVFTKTIKTKSRRSGWLELVDCVNESSITIGGFTCPPCTIRVIQVDFERLIRDPNEFKYRYTIGLQYLSNRVKLEGATSETEIGWDVSVVNQGCRGMIDDGEAGGTKPGRFTDEDEDGNKIPVSLPVLMDKDSKRIQGATANAYMMRVQAYERVSIPVKFYSEPS